MKTAKINIRSGKYMKKKNIIIMLLVIILILFVLLIHRYGIQHLFRIIIRLLHIYELKF